jgi:hypothetical protein
MDFWVWNLTGSALKQGSVAKFSEQDSGTWGPVTVDNFFAG